MNDPSPNDPTKTSKRRLLTQEEPSHASGIGDSSVIKDGGLYFLCSRDGSVPLEEGHGLGLYFRDCRFLSGYQLRLADTALESLAANDEDGFRSIFQLTNPNVGPVAKGISRQRIGARWRHLVDAQTQALRDELTFENYDTTPHSFPLKLSFAADFRDVFVIRGLVDKTPGQLRPTKWENDELVFSYEGADQVLRELRIRFSKAPSQKGDAEVTFDVHLKSHETYNLIVSIAVAEVETPRRPSHVAAAADELAGIEKAFERSIDAWMKGFSRVRSSSLWVERAVDRSLRDLRALRMSLDEHRFFAAGVPWFTTLFGRDSLICGLQTLAYRPEIAAETLRLIARFQGRRVAHWRDEEPGKVLHELRVGELARMGEIPYTPYYGTIDATPLFLIVLAEHVRWKGDLSLFEELRAPIEAALGWIDTYADHDGDGYVDYRAEAGHQLINQGWKDSGGAIVDSSGRRADPPIALCEVQGYVYRAKLSLADLFECTGDRDRAESLRREGEALRERFNRDFWLEDKQFYALALEHGGRRVDSISSNVGQALWTGVIDKDRVKTLVERLMSKDMYSGWGIRTLSSCEAAYNPIGYHLGAVWPHDNSIIIAGLRRCGYDREACQLFEDLVRASTHFPGNRLPEAFAGYSREEYGVPVRYPVACHPQAWAAGSIPFSLITLLGLEPDGLKRRLRIVRPALPTFIDRLELQHVRIGEAEVDLLFDRSASGTLTVQVQRLDGQLEVEFEPLHASPSR